MSLLEIKNLTTSFATEQGKVQAVRGISLSVEQGEIVGGFAHHQVLALADQVWKR